MRGSIKVHKRRDYESFKKFLEGLGVWHRFYEFSEHTMTAEAAAKQLGVSPEKIIKTLLVVSERNEPFIAIIPGDKRLDLSKFFAVTGSRVRMAKAREVEKMTGYSVGALPPVGHGIATYIDENVLRHDIVIGGGGSTHTLVELRTKDLIELTRAVICSITE